MLLEPRDRGVGLHVRQVHHQVDRPTAASLEMPVEELGTRDRKRTAVGTPLIPVAPIPLGAPVREHGLQGDRANRVGSAAEVAERHRRLLVELVAQAPALSHVDDVTVFRQPIDQGGRQLHVV